jgi:hypothetical protein
MDRTLAMPTPLLDYCTVRDVDGLKFFFGTIPALDGQILAFVANIPKEGVAETTTRYRANLPITGLRRMFVVCVSNYATTHVSPVFLKFIVVAEPPVDLIVHHTRLR